MNKPLALQLYSVRELAKNNFPKLLETVSKIGYIGVEFAGFHNYSVEELGHIIQDLGLRAVANHVELPTRELIEKIANDAKSLGCKTIVTGLAPDDMKSAEGISQCVRRLKDAIELSQTYDLTLLIHNHWWEFTQTIDGKTAYELIMTQVPELLSELDLYWVSAAGADTYTTLKTWARRVPLVHVKDGDLNGTMIHKPVGKGRLDISKILSSANLSTFDWLIVEIDNCETDIIDAITQSYRYLVDNNLGIGSK